MLPPNCQQNARWQAAERLLAVAQAEVSLDMFACACVPHTSVLLTLYIKVSASSLCLAVSCCLCFTRAYSCPLSLRETLSITASRLCFNLASRLSFCSQWSPYWSLSLSFFLSPLSLSLSVFINLNLYLCLVSPCLALHVPLHASLFICLYLLIDLLISLFPLRSPCFSLLSPC